MRNLFISCVLFSLVITFSLATDSSPPPYRGYQFLPVSKSYLGTEPQNSSLNTAKDDRRNTMKIHKKVHVRKKKKIKKVERDDISVSSTSSESTNSSLMESELAVKEGLRITLVYLQKLLLSLAAVVFIFIVLYSIYYINMLRKIYVKDLVSE